MSNLLVTADEILCASAQPKIPAWGLEAFQSLQSSLSETDFPCTFGGTAMKKGYLRFFFVDYPTRKDSLLELMKALTEFQAIYKDIDRMTSFMAIFEPNDAEYLSYYQDLFWDVLQFLHENDPSPWPHNIPEDPDDPAWEFCYNGEPIFVNCNTPVYENRLSRKSSTFNVLFQPRWIFEGLEKGTTRGDNARKKIRERLDNYDEISHSPLLGTYGESVNKEWKQYFLLDNNTESVAKCPFSVKK